MPEPFSSKIAKILLTKILLRKKIAVEDSVDILLVLRNIFIL